MLSTGTTAFMVFRAGEFGCGIIRYDFERGTWDTIFQDLLEADIEAAIDNTGQVWILAPSGVHTWTKEQGVRMVFDKAKFINQPRFMAESNGGIYLASENGDLYKLEKNKEPLKIGNVQNCNGSSKAVSGLFAASNHLLFQFADMSFADWNLSKGECRAVELSTDIDRI